MQLSQKEQDMGNYQFPKLFIKKLTQNAIIPQKGSAKAAGYDIFSSVDTIVKAKSKQLVKTGISIAIPSGNYGRIAPRSGLACKNFIDVGAGVIDEDYRGEVGVLLFNHSDEDFQIKQGDRIAQLIVEKITQCEIQEVQELSLTNRGEGGFGSTGINSINKEHTGNDNPLKQDQQ